MIPLSVLILLVNFADVGYTLWAIRRYGADKRNGPEGQRGLDEWNALWRWASHEPIGFILASTGFHVIALTLLIRWHCPAWALGTGLFVRVMVMVRNVNIVKDRRKR